MTEEVGLTVGNVVPRQPAVALPVMIGFGTQYLSGEIEIDGQEIVEAQWFTPDDDTELPDRWGCGITGRLIDESRESHIG